MNSSKTHAIRPTGRPGEAAASAEASWPAALFGVEPDRLPDLFRERGHPAFRGRQLAQWMYGRHAASFDEMSSLPAALREELKRESSLGHPFLLEVAQSEDGTRKCLFRTAAGHLVESALIPDRERLTLCLSSQAGCARRCAFCMTGAQGLAGQLTPGDIIGQYEESPDRERVTNIVFMGMGEPLDNLEAVLASLRVFEHPEGYGMSPTRLTVSTVGILPALERLLAEARCHIALSLHTPFPDQRAELMPVEKQSPIRDVLAVLRRARIGGQRRLTFEILLMEGVNDSPRHAAAVAELLRGLRCRVNLIAFNAAGDLPFRAPARLALEAYQNRLKERGLVATIRQSKGRDIAAACGMLSTRARSSLSP
jgi:23S rRNA (adenine2503-C2)-methyltransferase